MVLQKEKGRKLGDELTRIGDDQLIPGVGSVHKLVELAGVSVDLAKVCGKMPDALLGPVHCRQIEYPIGLSAASSTFADV